MKKITLIIKREYLTRIRKRTFIISTILFPLLYIGFIVGIGYIGAKNMTNLHVAVIDSSGYFDKGSLERANLKDKSTILTLVNEHPDSMLHHFNKEGYDGFIVIPSNVDWQTGIDHLELQTGKTFGIEASIPVERKLNSIWDDVKNEKLGIDDSKKTILKNSEISLTPLNVNDKSADSGVASTIGYVSGFLIYFILLIYGSQVMMGVMEEKTNRIAEVIVSSVKPFQLMLGKIIGIGLVALTQFLIWVSFVFIVYNVTKASGSMSGGTVAMAVKQVQGVFSSVNVPLILGCFAFYFLGGFFFYASLYAAIGSAVNEDMREAQSLSFPITLIVIFSIGMMSVAIKDPSGPVAVWGSIIPFSAPIIMMTRVPFGVPETVPYWQLALSMAMLVIGFLFTVWLSGKIYRTGILMYGKKPTWKEMLKWAFRRN